MNSCIISGLPTNNKYKSMFIHPEVIDAAKQLVIEEKCNMNEAFRYLSLALAESTMQRLDNGEIPDEPNVLRLT